MKKTIALLALALALPAIAAEDNDIKKVMKFAHKAPQGEKKLHEKIVAGTASEDDIKKSLELYRAIVDAKPPEGDQAAFKVKVTKVVAATEEVLAKRPDAIAHYKEAINCKACHSDHKPK